MQLIARLEQFCYFYMRKLDLPHCPHANNFIRFQHNRPNKNTLRPLKVTSVTRKRQYKSGDLQEQFRPQRYSATNQLVSAIEREENEDDDRVSHIISRYSSKVNAMAAEQEFKRGLRKKILAVRARTIRSKYFKIDKPQPSLLTWAAKEQIRFLHQEDPEEWTAERLAENFPVGAGNIKKILKSKGGLHRTVDIIEHDLEVTNSWADLKASLEDGNLSESDESLLKNCINSERESLIPNALGLKHITLLDQTSDSFKLEGPFSEIVKDCFDAKQKLIQTQKNKLRDQNQQLSVLLSDVSRLFQNLQNPKSSRFKKQKHEVENDRESASQEPQLPPLFVKDSIKRQAEKRELNEKTNPDDGLYISQKFKDDPLNDQKDLIYAEQKRLNRKVPEKIVVEKERAKNDSYVLGDCVYDEHGEFLYRIP